MATNKIFIAYKRIRFDIDEVIGIFTDRDKAETAITKYLSELKDKRQVELEELFFTLGASWEVEEWEPDMGKVDTYGLTEPFLAELIKKYENP